MAGQNGARASTDRQAGRGWGASPPATAEHHLRIENLSSIIAAYGSEAAEAGIRSLCQAAQAFLGERGFLVRDAADRLSAFSFIPDDGVADARRWLGRLLARLNSVCIAHPAGRFHLAVAAQGRDEDAPLPSAAAYDAGSVARRGLAQGDDPAPYLQDMAQAVALFEALDQGRLFLAWQAVSASDGSAAPLYHEALSRVAGVDGALETPAPAIAALERLGLMRPFDRHLVLAVLAELEASPDVTLAVNISVQSAVMDGWWGDIVARLGERPDIAHRLVIEITETAVAPSLSGMTHFLDAMRRLGCRFALDDFGVGHASFRQLLGMKPDIVKIDAFFLHRAELSSRGQAMLGHMVGLAQSIAPVVIIEGVETKRQRDLAVQVGGFWLQGYLFGRPALMRSWHQDDVARRIAALSHFAEKFPAPRSGRAAWQRDPARKGAG